MALVEFTSYDEVRACLGVSDDELEDGTLALGIYSAHLSGELDDLGSTLEADYQAVAAIVESSRTPVQQKFYNAARLFAAYAVAKHATTALPMFGPKDITDGKAGVSRFADSPYKSVITAINGQYDRLRTKLEVAYASFNSSSATTVTRTYFASTGLAVDPVTGS